MVWLTESSGGCLSVTTDRPDAASRNRACGNLRRGVLGRGVLGRANLVDLVTQSKSPTPQKATDLRIALFARIIRAAYGPHHGERDASQLFPGPYPSGAAVERGSARAGVAYAAADQARNAGPARQHHRSRPTAGRRP